jgi:hypothetical protein
MSLSEIARYSTAQKGMIFPEGQGPGQEISSASEQLRLHCKGPDVPVIPVALKGALIHALHEKPRRRGRSQWNSNSVNPTSHRGGNRKEDIKAISEMLATEVSEESVRSQIRTASSNQIIYKVYVKRRHFYTRGMGFACHPCPEREYSSLFTSVSGCSSRSQ